MRLSHLLVLSSAVLLVAPVLAGGGSHNTLTWDALNDNGPLKLESKYTERWGRQSTQQELQIRLDGVAPGTPVHAQVNGVELLPMTADNGGSCGSIYNFQSPRADGVRPAANRRIDKGDVIRVYNLDANIDVSAVYRVNGEP
ncbi:MAG: hypothetical protein EYC70_02230 [Planctomycetota bacterium]|nr:MAG: hypothetical protein EYC70_02230 [Planctomycetota bacterium]